LLEPIPILQQFELNPMLGTVKMPAKESVADAFGSGPLDVQT